MVRFVLPGQAYSLLEEADEVLVEDGSVPS